MNTKKILKKSTAYSLALTLLLGVRAFAEEASYDAQDTFTQVDNAEVTAQSPLQAIPPAMFMNTAEDQSTDETTPPPENVASSTDMDNNEEGMDLSLETGEDTLAVPLPDNATVSITLKWDISTENSLLRIGDPITLTAEITAKTENYGLQWQVATKPAQDLLEGEPEWANLSGKTGTKYTFTVQEDMQTWRWRLCVTAPDSGKIHSEEMRLPKLTAMKEGSVLFDESETPLGVVSVPPLPVATITLTANVPLDEIAYGDEVTLLAEIRNPCEGMLLQWQYTTSDTEAMEEEWIDAAGARTSSYTYIITEENEGWLWRLLITAPEDEEEAGLTEEQSEQREDSFVSDIPEEERPDELPPNEHPDPAPDAEEAPLPDMPE